MSFAGILTVYMVIYGNYHCKDTCTGTVPLITVRNPEVTVGGYRNVQSKVSGVPEGDLRDNCHRRRKGSHSVEMPHCGRTVRLEWLIQTYKNKKKMSCGADEGGALHTKPNGHGERGGGGGSWRSKERRERGGGGGGAVPPPSPNASYSSAVISFASVGRHFPKNMALQSENPNR